MQDVTLLQHSESGLFLVTCNAESGLTIHFTNPHNGGPGPGMHAMQEMQEKMKESIKRGTANRQGIGGGWQIVLSGLDFNHDASSITITDRDNGLPDLTEILADLCAYAFKNDTTPLFTETELTEMLTVAAQQELIAQPDQALADYAWQLLHQSRPVVY